MAGKILGLPKDAKYDYEFMVVFPREDGDFDFHSNHETSIAYNVANEVGGVVFHNVRISGKKLKRGKKMIQECKCPKCGSEINNWWDCGDEIMSADSDNYFIDYNLHCKCGCKFRYTEWFKLNDTEIEVL